MAEKQLRYERVNTCKECGLQCGTGKACDVVKKPLRPYKGIRFTADGFDCALPVTIDSHSFCSYGCLYCFSNYLVSHRKESVNVGQTSLKTIENIFSGKPGIEYEHIRKGLKYDKKVNGYPCPVQLGGLTDPMDNIERQQGWLLEFIKLAIKYNQPVRMSTKGTLALVKEYRDAFAEAPHLFWVAFSTITCDDKKLELMDRRAPNATERLKAMKALSDIGVNTSLRFRPMMPGISDATPDYPKAYKTLIEKAAEAGAKAVSAEVVFYPGVATKEVKEKWRGIENILGVPMGETYKKFGKSMSCIRPAYGWTENIMHSVVEESHKNGLTVGISDPVWKQLTDSGCCCGILPDDPVFGNWERENATNRLLEAKNDPDYLIHPDDIVPPWADEYLMSRMVNLGAGPKTKYKQKHKTWGDKLREIWNDVKSERGPYRYFQGALKPVKRDKDGNILYKFVGLDRRKPITTPYWEV